MIVLRDRNYSFLDNLEDVHSDEVYKIGDYHYGNRRKKTTIDSSNGKVWGSKESDTRVDFTPIKNKLKKSRDIGTQISAGSAVLSEIMGGSLKDHAIGLGASSLINAANFYNGYSGISEVLDNDILAKNLEKDSIHIPDKLRHYAISDFKKTYLKKEIPKEILNNLAAYGGAVAAAKTGKYLKKKWDDRKSKRSGKKEG